MKNYELTYLISPDFSEEESKKFSEKINRFIQEEAGILEKSLSPFKKKLGYPIKKKGEGYLVTSNFSFQPTADQSRPTAGQPKVEKAGNPEKLENLEKKLKSENQILRYIILIKKTTKESEPRAKRRAWEAEIPHKITESNEPSAHRPKAGKVELKEIDKKIEEILKE